MTRLGVECHGMAWLLVFRRGVRCHGVVIGPSCASTSAWAFESVSPIGTCVSLPTHENSQNTARPSPRYVLLTTAQRHGGAVAEFKKHICESETSMGSKSSSIAVPTNWVISAFNIFEPASMGSEAVALLIIGFTNRDLPLL